MGLRLSFGCLGWAIALVQALIFLLATFLRLPQLDAGRGAAQSPNELHGRSGVADAVHNEPCSPCDEDEVLTTPWLRFRSWATSQGIWVHPALEVKDTGVGPRGIYAAVPVAGGLPLLRVPYEAMFTVPWCLANSKLAAAAHKLWHSKGPVRSQYMSKIAIGAQTAFWDERREEWRSDESGVLDTLILVLCFMDESSLGESSKWAPWLAVLPQSHDGAPLAMPTEELTACLDGAGSDIREAADRWRKTSMADYQLLVHELRLMHSHSFDEYLHWLILVGSRTHGFKLPQENGEHKAIVPFIDMLNHNHEGRKARWTYDAGSQEFTVNAMDAGIVGGQEVTVSYNVKSDMELFLFYGFSDKAAFREASLRLGVVDPRRDPLAGFKRELLMEHDLFMDTKLKNTAPMSPDDLARLLRQSRILVAENQEELDAVAKGAWPPKDLEERALAYLASTARALAGGAVESPASGDWPPTCVAYRERERELFKEVESFAVAAASSKDPPETTLQPWMHERVKGYKAWYEIEASGALKAAKAAG